jgi:two-component system, NarL family, response regulator NreC
VIAGITSAADGKKSIHETLTSRERDVLHLAAEGYTNPEVSQHYRSASVPCETYRANLMRKLGLRNQTDLVRYALQRGTAAHREVDPPEGEVTVTRSSP